MRAQTEECPILLLDDILSELDPTRRGYVLGQAGRAGQTIISTTDLTDFPPAFLSEAAVYRVDGGALTRIERPAGETIGEMIGAHWHTDTPQLVAERPADASPG